MCLLPRNFLGEIGFGAISLCHVLICIGDTKAWGRVVHRLVCTNLETAESWNCTESHCLTMSGFPVKISSHTVLHVRVWVSACFVQVTQECFDKGKLTNQSREKKRA